MDYRVRNLLFVLIFVSLVVSLFVGYRRMAVEQSDVSVELAMDYSDIFALSQLEGIKLDTLLARLKDVGVRSIALPEDTLDSAERRGDLTWLAGYDAFNVFRLTSKASPIFRDLLKNQTIYASHYYIAFPNASAMKRVRGELLLALGRDQVKDVNGLILDVNDEEMDLAFLGVGLPPSIYPYLKKNDFKVIPRLKNSFRFTSQNIARKLNLEGISYDDNIVIFDEDEVMGYPHYIGEVARELSTRHLIFGYIEFAQQLGDRSLASAMKENVIRIHSIPADEMELMTEGSALARMLRAVKERGVRLLYVRPFFTPNPGENLVETNLAYLSDLEGALKASGYAIDFARTNFPLRIRFAEILLIGLGVAAALLLLSGRFVKVPDWAVYLTILAIIGLPFLAKFSGKLLLLRKTYALLAAVSFPALSMILPFGRMKKGEFPSTVLEGAFALLEVFAISLIGAALVVGVTSDTLFKIGAEQFAGVKFALVLPLVFVALYFLLGDSLEATLKKGLRILKYPLSIGHVVLLGLLGIFGVLFILRSGNFGVVVPGFERHLRDLAEVLLAVRPRTKEFLVGYPVIIFTLFYLRSIPREWLWLPLSVAVIAPISLTNTFSHAHSPLLLSLIRSINGLWAGVLVGFIAVLFVEALRRLISKYQ